MSQSRVFLIGLFAALIALLTGLYMGSQHTGTKPPTAAVVNAEALANLFASSLDDVDGKPHPFAVWQGKTLVVNFWATWCPPCREEMPAFSRLQDRYAAQDVQFVGIALDVTASVRAFARQYPVSYPLLVAGSGGVELARQLGNASLSLPYTLVVSPGGDVPLVQLGPLAERDLDLVLRRTLAY
jgi:thiol-disulfide isomerase/thioredoxin